MELVSWEEEKVKEKEKKRKREIQNNRYMGNFV